RLAMETSDDDPDTALVLATTSVTLAAETSDPRAVAHGLEALALVHWNPAKAARALGGARFLRRRTSAPLPTLLNAGLLRRERDLQTELGDQLVHELRAGTTKARRLKWLRGETSGDG